ncbi:hypothetical protein D3C81_668240 [compost metagenome]
MNITNSTSILNLNLYKLNQQTERPTLQTATGQSHPEKMQDILEISDEARKIAADIDHEVVQIPDIDRPKGAPDDYVKTSDLMKQVDSKSYDQMNEYFKQNDKLSGLSLLIKFAQQIPEHPEWVEQYKAGISANPKLP